MKDQVELVARFLHTESGRYRLENPTKGPWTAWSELHEATRGEYRYVARSLLTVLALARALEAR